MPDPKKMFPPDLLPGQLGLNEGQVALAAGVVREELHEKRHSSASVIATLRMIVIDPDRLPVQMVLDALEDEYNLIAHGVAMRAIALGIRLGKGEPVQVGEPE